MWLDVKRYQHVPIGNLYVYSRIVKELVLFHIHLYMDKRFIYLPFLGKFGFSLLSLVFPCCLD